MQGNFRAYAHEVLTGADGVQSPTLAAGKLPVAAYISVEGGSGVRFTFNGTVASATDGHPLAQNEKINFDKYILSDLQFYIPTGVNVLITLAE